ncbi:MAG: radical SAM protein [bacterium]|nr:radical SAM protein [bacterium]
MDILRDLSSSFFIVDINLSTDWQGQKTLLLEKVKNITFLKYLLKRLDKFGISSVHLYVSEKNKNREIIRLSKEFNLKLINKEKEGLEKIIGIMEKNNKEYLININAESIFVDKEIIGGVISTLKKEKTEHVFLCDFSIGIKIDGFSLKGIKKLFTFSEDGSFDISLLEEKFISRPFIALKKYYGLGLNLGLRREEDVRFAKYIINSFKEDEYNLAEVINFLSQSKKNLTVLQNKSEKIEDIKYYSKKLNMVEANNQSIKLNSYPFLIQIEDTTRCNLKCKMCQRERNDYTQPQEDMEMDVFNKLLPIFPYISQSSLFGIGEPLLNKKFNEMFAKLRENLVDVLFYTNGMLINEEMAKIWVKNGLRDIIFSLDGTSFRKVENLRKGLKYKVVLDKIRIINRYKKLLKKKLPNIRISYTVMKSNLEELLDMVKLCKELGVGKIIVTFMVAFIEEFRSESLYFHQELTNEVFRRSIVLGRKLGIDVQVPGFFSLNKEKKRKRRKPCLEPWTTTYVFYDGKVRPCCFTDMVMGDLKRQSFEEIWNGKPYQKLREKVNTDNPPFECSRCHFVKYQNVDDIKSHIKI